MLDTTTMEEVVPDEWQVVGYTGDRATFLSTVLTHQQCKKMIIQLGNLPRYAIVTVAEGDKITEGLISNTRQ